MCYAIPGKVTSINKNIATVSYFGQPKKAINELDGLCVGDYIYAQGGYVIKIIPQAQAQAVLATWKEVFFDLQNLDLRLSRLDTEDKNIEKKLLNILDKAALGQMLKKDELLYLFNLRESVGLGLLFKTANFLRSKNFGNSCCVHGIIEISNYCKRNCFYCGISMHNTNLKRYRMTKEEILSIVDEVVEKYGFKALVLQSGEDSGYDIEELYEIICEIKAKYAVLIFISFGEIGTEGLKRLYQAGARGLLLRFETSNPELYKKFHPGYFLEARIENIKKAYNMGYLISTGSLIGLPGQTDADILNDILLAKELNAEMFSFGPFLPSPNTPLADLNPPAHEDMFKTLAIARLVDQAKAKILITTAFETLDVSSRRDGLLSGANSVMLNVTPLKYRSLYSIYPKRAHEAEEISQQIGEAISLLRLLGRAPTDLGI